MARGTLVKPIEILVVEDNPGDIRLIQEVLKDSKVHNRLHVTTDGVEALAFLRREGAYAEAPRPDLMLLDLMLPRKNGWEVLGEMKADEALQDIPVVVLTSSAAESYLIEPFVRDAGLYLTKPIDFDKLSRIVKSLDSFWFTIVACPGEIEAGPAAPDETGPEAPDPGVGEPPALSAPPARGISEETAARASGCGKLVA